jgi:hypothetical protein
MRQYRMLNCTSHLSITSGATPATFGDLKVESIKHSPSSKEKVNWQVFSVGHIINSKTN